MCFRSLSSSLISVSRCGRNSNILRIEMNSPPVNSLGISLIVGLKDAIKDASMDPTCDGIILASSCRVFSAGLNMRELHGATDADLSRFWDEFQSLCFSLYGTKQAVVAEIGGHAPAAATILASCCDSRVAAPGVTVGLNESAFGLEVPLFTITLMHDLMGVRAANRAMSLGTLFKSEEAKQLGLVDVIAPSGDADVVQQVALAECEKFVASPGQQANKINQRRPTLAKFLSERQEDHKAFTNCVSSEVTQKRLKAYLESLSNKTKK